MEENTKRDSVSSVLSAVAFLIAATAFGGLVVSYIVGNIYFWLIQPEQVGTERLIEVAKLCGEMGAGVEWVDGTDGLYRDVRCQGQ